MNDTSKTPWMACLEHIEIWPTKLCASTRHYKALQIDISHIHIDITSHIYIDISKGYITHIYWHYKLIYNVTTRGLPSLFALSSLSSLSLLSLRSLFSLFALSSLSSRSLSLSVLRFLSRVLSLTLSLPRFLPCSLSIWLQKRDERDRRGPFHSFSRSLTRFHSLTPSLSLKKVEARRAWPQEPLPGQPGLLFQVRHEHAPRVVRQHNTTYSNALKLAALHVPTVELQHTATHCNTLCNTLQHTVTRCATRCNTRAFCSAASGCL